MHARVAARCTDPAREAKRNPADVQREITALLNANASAPGFGLFGPKMINVLEANLQLRARYGAPPA
jgi:K+-transporting ATPase c subunit